MFYANMNAPTPLFELPLQLRLPTPGPGGQQVCLVIDLSKIGTDVAAAITSSAHHAVVVRRQTSSYSGQVDGDAAYSQHAGISCDRGVRTGPARSSRVRAREHHSYAAIPSGYQPAWVVSAGMFHAPIVHSFTEDGHSQSPILIVVQATEYAPGLGDTLELLTDMRYIISEEHSSSPYLVVPRSLAETAAAVGTNPEEGGHGREHVG